MISKKIRQLRSEQGWTQKQLSEKLHVGKTTVSNYETGYSESDLEMLNKIAKLFDVSVDYLLGITLQNNESNNVKYKVPVFYAVACGNPFIADEDIIDREEINPKLKSQGEHFGVKLRGDSMLPDFKDGDVVIVRKQSDVDSGDIAIVRVNGDEATMKIVEKSPEGITLIATNPSVFLPKFYTNNQIETTPVSIIGKVIEQRRKFW